MEPRVFGSVFVGGCFPPAPSGVCRQSQLAKMTSDLCEDGGDKRREKETRAVSKASSASAGTSTELPGPWTVPLSPVTPSTPPLRPTAAFQVLHRDVCSRRQVQGGHRPLRSPPGLGYSTRGHLDHDWLHLLLEADHGQGEDAWATWVAGAALADLRPFVSR